MAFDRPAGRYRRCDGYGPVRIASATLENTGITPKSVAMPEGTAPSVTYVDIRDSPVKPESQEGAEDAGEVKKET